MELEFTERNGKAVPFPTELFTMGSAADCELRYEQLKPKHLQVHRESDGTWFVRDISGSATLKVDGYFTLEAQLVDGGVVTVGPLQLRVRATTFQATVATPARSSVHQAPPASVSGGTGHLGPGEVIDNRYRIIESLAEGGMGEVYRAEHLELGKLFALKVMRPELSRDPDFVARFKREAIASSRIGQQNIVDISDFGRTAEGRFYFVMEFLEGKTLGAVLRKEGPLPADRVIAIGLQVARALAAAHRQGIVHRDMKPENVMLIQRAEQTDFVKVVDFGVAKVSSGHGHSGQTSVGMLVGTPQYMSPEQASGLKVDLRTDIYALGLIFHELLRGKPAFTAETPTLLLVIQMTQPPPPLTPEVQGVPAELSSLIFAMLEKKPEQRPASMDEVISRLEAAKHAAPTGVRAVIDLGGQPPATRRLPVAPTAASGQTDAELDRLPPRSKAWLVPVVGLAIAALAGGVYFFNSSKPPATVAEPPAAAVAVAPPPSPVVAPEPVKPAVEVVALTFRSLPERAEVYEGDVLLGVTPLTLSHDRGTLMQLRFSLKGRSPVERKVRFEKSDTLEIELPAERAAPKVVKPAPKPTPGKLHDDPYSDGKELKDLPD